MTNTATHTLTCTDCHHTATAPAGHFVHDGWSGLYEWSMADGNGGYISGETIHAAILLCDTCTIRVAVADGITTHEGLADWIEDRIMAAERFATA